LNLRSKNIFQFSCSKICVLFKLLTRRCKAEVVNNCDGEKIEGKIGRMHFQKQRKQCFSIFESSKKSRSVFRNCKRNFFKSLVCMVDIAIVS